MKSYKKVEIYTCNNCNKEVLGLYTNYCDICSPKINEEEYYLCLQCKEKTLCQVEIRVRDEKICFHVCKDCFNKSEVSTAIKSMFKLFRDIKLEWNKS